MNLATLSRHPHFYSNHHELVKDQASTIYETNCLIKSRSTTCASLSESTMSILVEPMTRDHLDTNTNTHDKNSIILISIMISFMLCLYIMNFINKFKIAINSFIYQMNINIMKVRLLYMNIRPTISAKGDGL